MNKTSIEWTDFSANPLKYRNAAGAVVWGCSKVSAGCTHCYSEALAQRYRRGGPFNNAQMATLTPFLDAAELHRMLTYKPAAGKRCFVGDMTDVFGAWVPDELLDRLFAVFALRPDVTWQVLTKRPERMRRWFEDSGRNAVEHTVGYPEFRKALGLRAPWLSHWPLPNVWLGTSVENQATADVRIPHLLQTPAVIRFISAEPLLGPLDLTHVAAGPLCPNHPDHRVDVLRAGTWTLRTGLTHVSPEFINHSDMASLDWVIVGGESGPRSRPCRIAWLRDIVAQCRSFGTPVFVKQVGSTPEGDERPPESRDPVTGARTLTVMEVIEIRDRKGGKPSEWPQDLRVRQFPEVSA